MAFAINTAPAAQTNAAFERAQGFVNLYINRPDGTKVKVGKTGIPLYMSRKMDAAILNRLAQEGGVDAFKQVVTVEFQLVDDGKQVDAPF